MAKFYAVRKGIKPGIYQTWDETKQQIEGFSGAEFKSFKSLDEAEKYLHEVNGANDQMQITQNLSNEEIEELIKDSSENVATIFTDGSFSEEKKRYSFGAIIFNAGKKIELYNSFIDEEGLRQRNFAGELRGVIEVLKWSITNNIKTVNLFYDLEGIGKLATGEHKPRSGNTIGKEYVDLLAEIRKKENLKIVFYEVDSHTGIVYNEEADALARKAIEGNAVKTRKDGSLYVKGLSKSDWLNAVDELNEIKSEEDQSKIKVDTKAIKEGHEQLIITNLFDRVVINVYGTNTTYLQGKPSLLNESLVNTGISYLDDSDSAIKTLNNYHALQIEEPEIKMLAREKLPNVDFSSLDPKVRITYESSLYNYLITSNMPEYTCLLTPIFRLCEHHLHNILYRNLGINTSNDGRNNFAFFNRKNGVYMFNQTSSLTEAQETALNDLYNYYAKNRHTHSHWGQNDFESAVITSNEQFRNILDKGFMIIDRCAKLFV